MGQHNELSKWLYRNFCAMFETVSGGDCEAFIGPLTENQSVTPVELYRQEGQPTMSDTLEQILEKVSSIDAAVKVGISGMEGKVVTVERKIDTMERKMDRVSAEMKEVKEMMTNLLKLQPSLNKFTNTVEGKVDVVEGKMDVVEGKVDAVEGKIDAMEKKMDNVNAEMKEAEK